MRKSVNIRKVSRTTRYFPYVFSFSEEKGKEQDKGKEEVLRMNAQEMTEQYLEIFRQIHQFSPKKPFSEEVKGEIGVLHYLFLVGKDVTPGEIKETFHIGSGRVADILKCLEKKGLVCREHDPADKRKVLVSLTKKGQDIAYKKKKELRKRQEELISFLGEEDATDMIRIMKRVVEFLKSKSTIKD